MTKKIKTTTELKHSRKILEGLIQAPGVGTTRIWSALSLYGAGPSDDPSVIAEALNQLACDSSANRRIRGIHPAVDQAVVGRVMGAISLPPGVVMDTILDRTYPKLLRQIYRPPLVLFRKGPAIQDNCYAVVGSRTAPVGRRVIARSLVEALCSLNKVVVSGGARGIDALSHSVALRCHASTVVVLGTGIDRVYPPEHRDLFDAVLASSGTLVTSFLPGMGPHKGNFPIRNGIIAGLSRAVLVVSAQARSGTSITAAYARDEGRDVWAVPGDPEDLYAAGTNSLIRSGAALIASADDIYKELGVVKKDLSSQSGERVWSDLEKVLLVGPLDDEGLAIKLSYSLEQVETELLELMINGRICRNYAGLWEIID